MRAAVPVLALLLLPPVAPAESREDPAGDVATTHAVAGVPAHASPYARCAQPSADILALEGGASAGDRFRLALTLAAWGTPPDCPLPLARTRDTRFATLLAMADDASNPVSRLTLFWTVEDGADHPLAALTFRDGRTGQCADAEVARHGSTLAYSCPLTGTASVGGATRQYDLRGLAWTYAGQTNHATGTPASTVRFSDATVDMPGRT